MNEIFGLDGCGLGLLNFCMGAFTQSLRIAFKTLFFIYDDLTNLELKSKNGYIC